VELPLAWSQTGEKWALVSWEKIFQPTYLGGLGLHDPGNLNNVMGEKI
jgi:hypothetical protein